MTRAASPGELPRQVTVGQVRARRDPLSPEVTSAGNHAMVSCSKASVGPLRTSSEHTPAPERPDHGLSLPRPHRRPAQIHHKTLQSLSGFRRSLQPRKVEVFEDGIGGDALDAVVTDLTSDISQGSGPRVDGLMVSRASRRQLNP